MGSARGYGVYQPRSRRAQVRDAMANAREWFAQLMREAVRRSAGVALLLVALAALAALASYNSADPGFNNATSRAAENWLGTLGAYLADGLLQTIGVAALALIVPVAGWGWRMTAGGYVQRLVSRSAALVLGTLFLAIAFGALPAVGALTAGPGGIVGAFAWGLTAKVAAAYGGWLAVIVPVIFALVGGTLVFQAAGVPVERVVVAALAAADAAVAAGSMARRVAAWWPHRERDTGIDDEIEDDDELIEPDDEPVRPAKASALAAAPEPLTPRKGAPRVLQRQSEENQAQERPPARAQPRRRRIPAAAPGPAHRTAGGRPRARLYRRCAGRERAPAGNRAVGFRRARAHRSGAAGTGGDAL